MTAVSVVSVAAGAAGIVFGLVTLFRNKRIDDSERGERGGVVLTELGYIKAQLDDLKRELRDIRESINDLTERVTRAEESAKQAHKRIDALEQRIGKD